MMKFVFDLDDTICFNRHEIADEIKSLLERADQDYGHEIIFATARSYRDSIKLLGDKLSQCPVVGLNGGLVYDKGKLIFHRHLDQSAYLAALSWCYSYNLPFFVDNTFDYATENKERMPFIASVDPLNLARELPVKDLKDPIKLVISLAYHEDLLDDLRHDLTAQNTLDISYDYNEKCLYLNPLYSNKATAVLNLFGMDFVAFGNDQNDIELFKTSLYSVQVGNFKSLRDFADEQVAADTATVAQKIEYLFEKFS